MPTFTLTSKDDSAEPGCVTTANVTKPTLVDWYLNAEIPPVSTSPHLHPLLASTTEYSVLGQLASPSPFGFVWQTLQPTLSSSSQAPTAIRRHRTSTSRFIAAMTRCHQPCARSCSANDVSTPGWGARLLQSCVWLAQRARSVVVFAPVWLHDHGPTLC